MANENVIFKKGLSTSLPEEITPGALLVETDTGKIYLDDQSELIVTLSDVKVDAITYRLSTETSGSLTGILQERYFTEGNFPTELGQIYYQTAINQFLKVVMLDPGESAQLIYLDSAPIVDTSPQQYRLIEQDRIELSYENIFYNAIAQDSTQPLPTPGNYANIPRTRIRADAVPQSSKKNIVYSLYIQSVTTETGYFYGLFTGELLSEGSDTIRITCLSYLTNTCYIGDSVPQPTITKQQGSLYFNTTTHIFYVYSLVEGGTYEWIPINSADQAYNPESANAQSGVAVEQAIKPTTMYFDKIKFRVSTNVLNESMVGSAAGWSNSGLDLTHSSGTTNPLQLNFGNLAVKNEEWLISFNATGVTSDYLYISFGNNPLTKVYNSGEEFNIVIPVSENNDSLIFTPTKEFNGTITNLQARKIVDEGGTEISLSSLTVSTGGTKKIKSGFWNVIIGTDNTLANSPNATRTIAMGYAALSKLISGNRNIAIGTHSMREMIGGESNISIGADNMMLVNQAEECISIGLSALSKGTGIKQCIAIGSGALAGKEGKGATSCIAIGKNAGLVAEGTNCIYIGSGAGIKDLRSGNIVIGNGAFREAEYGNNNIVIGNGAYSGSSSYNGCTIIGDGAQPDKAKQTVIGNGGTVETKVYGDFVVQGTDGIERKTIFSDGSVPMTGDLNMDGHKIIDAVIDDGALQ